MSKNATIDDPLTKLKLKSQLRTILKRDPPRSQDQKGNRYLVTPPSPEQRMQDTVQKLASKHECATWLGGIRKHHLYRLAGLNLKT